MPKTRKNKSNPEPLAQAAPATPPVQVQPNFIMAPDFKTIYTNFVNAAFSPLDIFFVVGEAVGTDPEGKPIVVQRGKVIMSPMEAKIVAAIMVHTVAQYEKQFGKIAVPKEMMPPNVEGD
jgi:Protein of unknown function (DUF3467)